MEKNENKSHYRQRQRVHAKNQESENKKKNCTTDYGNRTSKLVQKITDDTDSTNGADDTDCIYDTDISSYKYNCL